MAVKEKEKPVSGEIIETEYSSLMKKSYIDYAMSVIIARALPDVRDGLKPVQRRTLYDMYELGIRWDRPYRKSARIVGDTMGKYHPHGDSSIYEALVNMAQDFKKGLPLVDGHGNFGSIEGDGAAAMRYTEARLQKITEKYYLGDLDKAVVDFGPNFDETEKEPTVLPVRIPNLLVNGAEGIAVGMATSIPPHNLSEVIDGCIAYMKNPDMNTQDMLKLIQGPDFPTGGIVCNKEELLSIYSTGVGKLRIRGKVEVENAKNGHTNLVVTEIPYTMIGAGIGKFLNDVAHLVETRETNDITDISNQSSKEGIRIVIELKRGADVEAVKNLLFKKTRLEDTFGVNMLAVADGKPETLGLVPVIRKSIDFQFELMTRKYTTLLSKEREKKEIQEGLIAACDCIDLIIEILRGSKTRDQAKTCLVSGNTEGIRFKSDNSKKAASKLSFTERQADAILDMRLYRLIGLEIDALRAQFQETMKNIAEYSDILSNRASMAKVIINDLKAIKKEFGYERRTEVSEVGEAVIEEKPLEETEVYAVIDRFFYAKAIDTATYERNKEAIDSESRYVIRTTNLSRLLIFSSGGNMHVLKCMDLPQSKLKDKGVPIDNISTFDSSVEDCLYIESMDEVLPGQLIFLTKDGMIKNVPGSEFDVMNRRTVASTKLLEGDSLVAVLPYDKDGNATIVITSEKNYRLRFLLSDIPEKKKNAVGAKAMALSKGDRIKKAEILSGDSNSTLKIAGRATKGTKK